MKSLKIFTAIALLFMGDCCQASQASKDELTIGKKDEPFGINLDFSHNHPPTIEDISIKAQAPIKFSIFSGNIPDIVSKALEFVGPNIIELHSRYSFAHVERLTIELQVTDTPSSSGTMNIGISLDDVLEALFYGPKNITIKVLTQTKSGTTTSWTENERFRQVLNTIEWAGRYRIDTKKAYEMMARSIMHYRQTGELPPPEVKAMAPDVIGKTCEMLEQKQEQMKKDEEDWFEGTPTARFIRQHPKPKAQSKKTGSPSKSKAQPKKCSKK